MPNLRQLEYLVALAETRHFRRAAELTNTTQPTLSEQIKALEERLNVQLVERTTARVIITPIGVKVVEIAKRMLCDANEIRALATSADNDLTGLLRLGLPPTIGPYLMQYIAAPLHREYPKLQLYLREEVSKNLLLALEDGIFDVIIKPLPIRSKDFEVVTLFREPLLLTIGADHPLATRKRLVLADLDKQDVLILGPNHHLHEPIHALCREAGANLRFDFEGTSLDMLREMIVMGFGVSFMPRLFVERELASDANLKTFKIADRNIFTTIGMAWRVNSARREVYMKLAEFFKTMLKHKEKEPKL